MKREHSEMKLATHFALSAAVAGSLALGTVNAQTFSTTLDDFILNPIVVDIFTFTYVGSAAAVNDPAPPGGFPAVNATNLPDEVEINVSVIETGTPCCKVANFQIANLAQLTGAGLGDTFNLAYTIELYEGDDFENPLERFQTIGHGSDVDSVDDNTRTTKSVWGQSTDLVTDPTFNTQLTTTNGNPSVPPSATCGVCRKFAVNDTMTINFDGPGGEAQGILNSVSNTYRVGVPVPAPLALVGAGLLALGATYRARKH